MNRHHTARWTLPNKKMLLAIACSAALGMAAQNQQYFPQKLPCGNYSGICHLGKDLYAVVDDKAANDGFYIFRITMDLKKNIITDVENKGYFTSGQPNRDMESICYFPELHTLFISGEKDNEVYEYTYSGMRTGRRLQMPSIIKKAAHNAGIEALTYDTHRRQFYVVNERPIPSENHSRLFIFGADLKFKKQYLYPLDKPYKQKDIYGVSEICALADGRVLVMERDVHIPLLKLGAWTITRIYEIDPTQNEEVLKKKKLCEFRTSLTSVKQQFANFEGFCQVAPNLLLMVADSQNGYKGILCDWLRLQPIP